MRSADTKVFVSQLLRGLIDACISHAQPIKGHGAHASCVVSAAHRVMSWLDLSLRVR
jgi:hypothetical protein